jgi:putative intracellular protease/amidase
MAGTVCLQGGKEFGSSCRDLDLEVLRRTPIGPVVVLAGAASPGRDYATASRNAARYYANLGGDPGVPAPDPREDLAGCLAALAQAELVVLPGGSPTRLLEVLVDLGDGAVGDALRARHEAGATISGASAGAMVLCSHTWRPDGPGDVVAGLGLVPGLALPHFRPDAVRDVPVGDEVVRWGLPECGGVLVVDGTVEAAGAGEPAMVRAGVVEPLPRGAAVPLP